MEENVVGKIKSIACKDFITYDMMKHYPGEFLNIIIGPNGTGKSTIVAAIILGMGGHCKLLSRSKDISDFVKNGKDKAIIEIELFSDKDSVVTFHRSFDKHSKEQFIIDGRKVSHKEYLRRAKDFNVQIDNLCQFLPQDRVQDFTKMNPQELLRNTQVSVCSEEIIQTFEKLIEKRDEQKNIAKVNADNITKLRDAEERNEQLKVQIENINTKKKLVEKYNLCMKKKNWLQYDILYKKLKDIEADKNKMTDLVKTKEEEIKPLQYQANKINAVKEQLKKNINDATKKSTETKNEFDKLFEATEKFENDINKSKRDLNDIVAAATDRENDIREATMVIKMYESDLREAKSSLMADGDIQEKTKSFQAKMNQIKGQNEELLQKRSGISKILEEKINPAIVASERKIASIANVERQRLDKLRNHFEDAYKAHQWLQQHRNEFESQIFDPILVEINVKNQSDAKYIENTISVKDLSAFVCTSKNDMAKLIKKFRNELGLAVNVAFSEPANQVQFRADYPIQNYARYGLHSYLLDMIDGPAPILNYLCRLYGLHRIAVGNDQTYDLAGSVPNEITKFFSTNHRFTVSVSRYSGAKASSCTAISDRNLLNIAIDTRLLDSERNNLAKLKLESDKRKNSRNQIEQEIKKNETLYNEIKTERKKLDDKVFHVRQSAEKLRKKEEELKKLNEKNFNIEEEQLKFKKKVDTLVGNLFKIQMAKIVCLEKYKANVVLKSLCQKKMSVFEEGNAEIENKIQEAQAEVRRLMDTLDKIKNSYDDTKQKCKQKQNEAKALTDNMTPNNPSFPYMKKFQSLPEEIEELQTKMDELQGRIDCIQGADQSIFDEFESRKKLIEELQEAVQNSHKNSENLEKKLQELHDKWYPAFKNVVDIINENFSNFMKMMGFVGEVEIIRKDERDYNDYGIQIRVQYRNNERLQPLSRYVQSGGERAVAIAVYTMSLQHISHVPFRCVDEINQGMDPKNEAKIFEMLVDLTCRPQQSQYFFITPKLLPGLPYNDLMTVSIVHNGKNIEDPFIYNEE